MTTGTYDIESLLAARFQSAAEFGLETIEEVLAADLVAHNEIVADMVGNLCEITIDRQRIYGSSVEGEMVESDEYSRSRTQLHKPGSTVGFPLRLFQHSLGWTKKWFQVATPADVATGFQGAQKAHLRSIQTQIRQAAYRSTNYTYNDHLVDKIDLDIKRFVNADSAPIPNGPNGEIFDATTHTHYNANATLTTAAVDALIEDVVEHGHGAAVKIAIARADETAWRALTGFTPYNDPRLILGTQANQLPNSLDITRIDNRAIGIYNAAEVWVKSWAVANYAYCYDAMSPNKGLAYRQRAQTSLQGLAIVALHDTHPLVAQFMEVEFGLGSWTRTNGAILQFNNGSYSDPF